VPSTGRQRLQRPGHPTSGPQRTGWSDQQQRRGVHREQLARRWPEGALHLSLQRLGCRGDPGLLIGLCLQPRDRLG